jgi:hypothetical protein
MTELTPRQIAILDRLVLHDFAPVAFPLYANAVGIRKGDYAALLAPLPAEGFRLFGEPCVLLEGNLTVRVARDGRSWFVWKKQRIEATPERVAELDAFVKQLKMLLEPRV